MKISLVTLFFTTVLSVKYFDEKADKQRLQLLIKTTSSCPKFKQLCKDNSDICTGTIDCQNLEKLKNEFQKAINSA